MADGRDVLVVFDDLTRHARAYRELSLLLRRPPGREAYPGDIFYLHSRLLERATHMRREHGGGSITALPIVETQGQDISAYIPTNLISITDGQIYVSPELFRTGQLPAIDIGRSVSRVGGKAQYPAYRDVSGELRLAYAQFEELETFSRFATRLDADTRRTIERGRRIRAALGQSANSPMRAADQLVVLKAALDGLFDRLDLHRVSAVEAQLCRQVRAQCGDLYQRIDEGESVDESGWERLMESAAQAIERSGAAHEAAGDERAGADDDEGEAGGEP
jgi:F-type H+-transporting ATPase subunit alpha